MRGPRSIAAVALAGTLALADARAQDGGFCDDLQTLIGQAGENFARDPAPLAGAEHCAVSLQLSGTRRYQCRWRFGFRDAAAAETFAALNRDLPECLGGAATAATDKPVNHPDTYDQRRYRTGAAEIAVSLKDKSALGVTYVFLQIGSGAAKN